MVDILFQKVLVPMLNQLLTQVVCLVDAKNELLLFCLLRDVFLQIGRIKEIWVPGVNDLQQDM